MKILIVDDSRTMRKIVRNALEGMGYSSSSILEASDGVEALSCLRGKRYNVDIILADWNMPNMDGLAFLKQLQSVARLRRIPVIMVTGEAQRDRVVEAIGAGARNYVVKPFTPETLRQKVLAIEMELLADRKPTETEVLRLDAAKLMAGRECELPFLTQLPEELVASIYECASKSEHKEGETLVEPEDVVGSLHIVEGGEVEVLLRGPDHGPEVRGQGECFGELSFLSGDPAGTTVRARTPAVVVSVGKDDFENLLSEYPHLSFYLTRLLAKRARRSDPALATGPDNGLSGKLSMMTLAELIQTLHTSRKTGLLAVTSGDGDKGSIWLEQGDVRDARHDATTGEEAFYRLVTWADGSFVFDPEATGPKPATIFRPTMGLLMEGMRRQDELRRMRA